MFFIAHRAKTLRAIASQLGSQPQMEGSWLIKN